MKGFRWELVLALLAGLGLGLLYSWVISPIRYVNTTPNSLRADFKDQMRASIAAAYAATGNLERARARLALLGDTDSVEALSAQAQQMLASGASGQSASQLAKLAEDLQQPVPVAATETSIPLMNTTAGATVIVALATNATQPALTETVIPDQALQPPVTVNTPTPHPTPIPSPTPIKPFSLAAQNTLCQPDLQEGLLQVIVMDSHRHQLPGMKIVVTWDNGEDHFYTGFKPELGIGYADFIMQPGVIYSVGVADAGVPVSNISAPSCASTDGGTFTGVLRLTFQQ